MKTFLLSADFSSVQPESLLHSIANNSEGRVVDSLWPCYLTVCVDQNATRNTSQLLSNAIAVLSADQNAIE